MGEKATPFLDEYMEMRAGGEGRAQWLLEKAKDRRGGEVADS